MRGRRHDRDRSGGYDRLARRYRTLERLAFGGAPMRARLRHLDALADAERVLIVGEGDGRFVAALCRRHRRCRPTVIERSGAMIALARARLGADAERVRFVEDDVRRADPGAERFDAIVTHFALDLFDVATLAALIPRLAAALRPGGVWLIADFALPASGPRRWRARAWLALLHALFRRWTDLEATRLHDPSPLLRGAGLVRMRADELQLGLLRTEVWHLAATAAACEHDHEFVRIPEHFISVNEM